MVVNPKFFETFLRSPLGIIGLFITLVYLIAGIVFTYTLSTLPPCLQFLLILFIVFYPCILLAVFYFLVTRHSGKLYAPIDFRSDAGFQNYYKPESLIQKTIDFDPALAKKVEDASPSKWDGAYNEFVQFLGKEALASNLLIKHFVKKYGSDNVRKEQYTKDGLDYGWDIVVSLSRSSRLMVDMKFLSDKSSLLDIVEQAEKGYQLLESFNQTSSKERRYLLSVITEKKDEAKILEVKLTELINKKRYQFEFEAFSLEELSKE